MPLTRRILFQLAASAPLVTAASFSVAQDKPNTAGPYGLPISTEFPFEKKITPVLESEMAYIDKGDGPPVVFLHGNPTSSYLWRNIMPNALESGFRVIAPDLIGMGQSGKPNIGYTFSEHATYLNAFLDGLDLSDVTLVVHDWGSALGMLWARNNPERVSRIAYMEAIIPPGMPVASFSDMPKELADFFSMVRTEQGAELILGQNFFVETVLPNLGVLRNMQDAEMAAYRAPFPTPESRLPTLVWPRQIPIEGTPEDVVQEVLANGEWLTKSDIPKLLFHAEPGSLMPKPVVEWHAKNVPNLEVRFLGAGLHFLQEEHPHLIGQGLADWMRRTAS
ncbi:MAG: haloalkane dehalogenase [Pseudomonadota bacterium]